MALIEITDLTKTYRMGDVEVNALCGGSFEIEAGEHMAIMGPSGSGKSTLMNLLGCLDTPTSGSYFLNGEDVSKLDGDRLAAVRNRQIGFVFQQFNLLSKARAVPHVELPLVYAGGAERRQRALEALERGGLAERAHHRPRELSGGQQQRVAIARALVNSPSIVMADEPTGNLDTKTGVEILQVFDELNEDGITLVRATHVPRVAERCKRVMRRGDGQVGSDVYNHQTAAVGYAI